MAEVMAASRRGSPPRTRGARRHPLREVLAQRITPAYAGSTPPSPAAQSAAEDHPRVRGEHSSVRKPPGESPGSPPRTRGARLTPADQTVRSRITPAYAGSTPRAGRRCGKPKDHPRVRGEHAPTSIAALLSWGSPPRTRGAHLQDVGPRRERRITPAYAGSTRHP